MPRSSSAAHRDTRRDDSARVTAFSVRRGLPIAGADVGRVSHARQLSAMRDGRDARAGRQVFRADECVGVV